MNTFSKILYKLRLYLEKFLEVFGVSTNSDCADTFHKKFYDTGELGGTWHQCKYLGIPVQKNPMDLQVFQEILFDVKPDLIIETGTAYGGTTLFLAHLCDALWKGEIISIDITKHGEPPQHPRIKYVLDSSLSSKVHELIQSRITKDSSVLVILDSDHTKQHVLKELEMYHGYVTKGSYLIVEDTNVNGHPVFPEFGPGPMEALNEFLTVNKDFVTDLSREKYLVTFNPRGYLKRVKC